MPRDRSRSASPRKRDRERERERDERRGSDRDRERERERETDSDRRDRHRDRDRGRDRDRDRSRSRDRDRDRERDRERDRGKDREKRRERDRERERERGRDRDGDRRDRDRDRDRERDRERDRSRHERSRSERDDRRSRSASVSSEESLIDLAEVGASPITNEDFFIKAGEFRYWLKTERGKYLDELTSDVAHKYFRRFVRRWNDGALPRDCYMPHSLRASEKTRHKWQFAEHRSRVNSQELASVYSDVDRLTHSMRRPPPESHVPSRAESDNEAIGLRPADSRSRSPTPGPRLEDIIGPAPGPSRPMTLSERQLAREAQEEAARADRSAARKAERKSVYERAEELVPKAVGREGKMAERRAANEENKKMREKDTEVELDEGTLMGDSNPFQAALRAREAAAARRAERKAEQQADLRSALEERMSERRQKESATMEMFKALAKQRFG